VASGRNVPLQPPVLRTIAPVTPEQPAGDDKVALMSLS
jgi:hypothetical protein